ncbi:uncharacterized protein LOC143033547 [Oratosquilla oratoria]|uniref:uncharacterized protein LOC143033547 n=1 Tax=Oratosquilla oratoria TaxID=337810 RepID=UPI003F76EAA1
MASSNKIGPFNLEELPFDVYLALFEAHVATQDITDAGKKNQLFVSIGTKMFGILANLTAPDMPTTKTYDELIELMKKHFITKPSYHRSLCSFQQRRKVEKETVKELYADLKRLAKDCNFGTMFDARLRDQLFMAVDHEPYFKYLLAEDLKLEALTSSTLLERILLLEKAHMGEGETGNHSSSGTVQKVHSKTVSKCKHCGFPHPSSAFSEQEPEHEEHQCSANNVVDKSMLLKVSCNCLKSVKPEMYNFVLNDKSIPLEIDSGSCVSLIDLMNKVGIKITGLDEALKVNSVNDMDVSDNPKQLLDSYKVNDNLPIKGVEARIYVKKDATPKFIKARIVPLAHKELVDIAIQELVENKVIEPVAYSDWASPIVPVLKDSGKMRIYDILICAKSREDQSDKVKLVLNKLAEANVKLNLGKCEFNKTVIDFLGCVISGEGLSPSPNKIKGIRDAPVPENLYELQSFLGLVTYYRKSKFILECDASPVGVGCVLIQVENIVEKPIAFATVQKMTKADPVLNKLVSQVKFGWTNNSDVCREYSHVKNDLSILKGVVLFKNRAIVPSALRAKVLELLHSSHNGIVAMKAEARENIWWPRLSDDIEELAKS